MKRAKSIAVNVLARLAVILVFAALSIVGENENSQYYDSGQSGSYYYDYSFQLDYELAEVHINKDGGVDISYLFNFTNSGSIDGVDIGLPNYHYDQSSAYAAIMVAGVTYEPKLIHPSPYVPIGLAVEFDQNAISAINAYGAFKVYFSVSNPHMVYLNELVNGTAGIRFRPTWFNPDFQVYSTKILEQKIYFPEGFNISSEAYYLQGRPWDSLDFNSNDNCLIATWIDLNVDPSSQEAGYLDSGAAFPTGFVDKYYQNDIWESLEDFFHNAWVLIKQLAPLILVAAVFTAIIVILIWRRDVRAKDYFEPEVDVPGAGPRRDLTAVEAAIVLERPMQMVATMILFGLIKKGRVEILSDKSPMELKKLADKGDYPYEDGYLRAIDSYGFLDIDFLKDCLIELVNSVVRKMKGFDVAATRLYYGKICDAAWSQVKTAGTPEEFAELLAENNSWMMLDRDFADRMDHEYVHGPIIILGRPSSNATINTGIQNMAKSYVSQVRSACDNMVKGLRGMSKDVTSVTNPLPTPSTSGGSFGGSGGGGGCACACACACAGGGR
jgi:hypothetical protein